MQYMTGNITNCAAASAARRQSGFTLVESLVAMVVISVGMLGIAAMYIEGLRAGRTSVYRTVAVELAADLADRIRANPAAGAAYAGPAADNANPASAAELAAADLFALDSRVQARLPGGAWAVNFAAGARTDAYTVAISWTEPGVAQPLQYALAVQL